MNRFLQLLICVLLAMGVVAMAFAWLMYVFDDHAEDAIRVVPFNVEGAPPQ